MRTPTDSPREIDSIDDFDLSDFLPDTVPEAEGVRRTKKTTSPIEAKAGAVDPLETDLSASELEQIACFDNDDGIKIDDAFIIPDAKERTSNLKNSLFFRTAVAAAIAAFGAGTIWIVTGFFFNEPVPKKLQYPQESRDEKLRKFMARYQQEQSTRSIEAADTHQPIQPPIEETPPPPPIQETPPIIIEKEITKDPAQETNGRSVASLPLTSTKIHSLANRAKGEVINSAVLQNKLEPQNRPSTSIALLKANVQKHLVYAGTKVSGTIIAPVHYIEALGGTHLVVSIDRPLKDSQDRTILPVGSRLSLKVIISDRDVFVTEVIDVNQAQPKTLKTRATLTRQHNDRPILATVLNNRQTSLFFNRLLNMGLRTTTSVLDAQNSGYSGDYYSYYHQQTDPLATGLSTLSREVLNQTENRERSLSRENLQSKKVYLIQQNTKINIYFLDSFSI